MYSLNTNLGLWSTVVYRRNSHIRVAKVTIFLVSLRLSNPSRQSQTNTASDGQMLCQTARTDFSDSSTRSDMIQINQSWVCVVSLDSDRQHLETVGHDAIAPLDSKHAISKSDSTPFLYCEESRFWDKQRFDESDTYCSTAFANAWNSKIYTFCVGFWKVHKTNCKRPIFQKSRVQSACLEITHNAFVSKLSRCRLKILILVNIVIRKSSRLSRMAHNVLSNVTFLSKNVNVLIVVHYGFWKSWGSLGNLPNRNPIQMSIRGMQQ